ncbi:YaiI/YqxD family protein [Phascolarctobacterium sp.]|uniref:YaiI/YqxD family protein n=1 Tax=Phascolarctobacterium sp. TaxID=2049039 RepID=UPI00387027CE
MRILVDADACPVVGIIEKVAKEYGAECHLYFDTNHFLTSNYSETHVIGAGADAVDMAVVNAIRKGEGDVVCTQDYGVAAMALAKGAYAIHQSGRWYTNENIDRLLAERAMAKKARRATGKHHLKGPAKRTKDDDIRFEESFRRLVAKAMNS